MDKPHIIIRKEAIIERLLMFRFELKGTMRTRDVIISIGLKPLPGDRAALTAAMTECGMLHNLTHRPDVFSFK